MTSSGPSPIPDKKCFFVSRIGADASAERLNSDFVLNNILKPELEPLGYEVIRADLDPDPHMTKAILTHLMLDDLVVADITGGNPNVAYETAVRHATGKPCILFLQRGERPPFDLSVIKYLPYDKNFDSVMNVREQLKLRISFIRDNPSHCDSDIATLFGIQFLKLGQP
ncbi:MAG: hypothetical protein P4L53_24515 [Candidatus Obscuribacterales bacterium]|nr:hypothetical protein [Candidatus Obscuribacterales bacterium]